MPDPINLRQARKARARTAKEQQAVENRAKFGRTKAEQNAEDTRRSRLNQHLDGHKRDDDNPTG
jgi:uncharacterized protein DUF4169